jgi:hypothetical protein
MKVLTLSTYPIATPGHGGQIRLKNIVAAFRSAGHSVQTAGVLGSSIYQAEPTFEPLPDFELLASEIENPFLMEDWAIGRVYGNDDEYFERLASRISDEPDVIHVEQPWLSAFAVRLADEVYSRRAKIIYGSANVEHQLKKAILREYIGSSQVELYGDLVLALETEAIKTADGTACVSMSDFAWTKGLTNKPIVLAPNGVKSWTSTAQGRATANHITWRRKFALYCASAHPPNISGFTRIFSDGVGCFAPDERLVVAGSAGEHLSTSQILRNSAGLNDKLVSAGVVNDECLHGLLDLAHCIILPLSHGGGTNLKTAEALWSGKHIVSTNNGMRGFDTYLNAPGVRVADSPPEFKQALREALSSPPNEISQTERQRRTPLLWEHSLKSLVELAEKLIQ